MARKKTSFSRMANGKIIDRISSIQNARLVEITPQQRQGLKATPQTDVVELADGRRVSEIQTIIAAINNGGGSGGSGGGNANIDDTIVSSITTWSSQKSSDEITRVENEVTKEINTMKPNIATAIQKADNVAQDVAIMQQDVANAKQEATSAMASVSAIHQSVVTMQQDVVDAKQKADDATTAVASIQSNVADAIQKANAATTALDSIQHDLAAIRQAQHTHTNKEVLDKLKESSGNLLFNDEELKSMGQYLGFEPEVLFEGLADDQTNSVSYELKESYKKYDLLLVRVGASLDTTGQSMVILTDEIKGYRNQFAFGLYVQSSHNYDIQFGFPTETTFCLRFDRFKGWTEMGIRRIVGVKCKALNEIDDKLSAKKVLFDETISTTGIYQLISSEKDFDYLMVEMTKPMYPDGNIAEIEMYAPTVPLHLPQLYKLMISITT
ncbi:MAG: hypothetical protein HUJ62_04545 [Streptococcus gallolyticus]|nr:hypothetical protein [Streptococcus gallolyticus]